VTEDDAEGVALAALGWLAGSDDLLSVFLGATGADLSDMRARAGDPAFLAAVLDFVAMDDAWIAAMCAETGLDPTAPLAARARLPGGADPHWT
jgi:hypothetical protein